MISARAIDAERRAQRSLNRSIGNSTAMQDAEALIKRVMNRTIRSKRATCSTKSTPASTALGPRPPGPGRLWRPHPRHRRRHPRPPQGRPSAQDQRIDPTETHPHTGDFEMNDNTNSTYVVFNAASVIAAVALLCISLWLAPVDLSTKGYWGMGVLWLGGSLVNLVKYRMDDRQAREALTRLENAKNEKLIKDYVVGAA
jgi:hypothetical protein